MVKRNPYRQKRKRKAPSLAVKLAACLIKLGFVDRRIAVTMRTDEILALVEYDHGHLHALDGEDHPANFWPIARETHREKSKVDSGIVAKHDRALPKAVEHAARMARKAGTDVESGSTVRVGGDEYSYDPDAVRPKRKLQGRGFSKMDDATRARVRQENKQRRKALKARQKDRHAQPD